MAADDPRGFALGLAKVHIEAFGGVRVYQGATPGYRTLCGWFDAEDMLVTVQITSQPEDANQRNAAAIAIHDILASSGR